MTNTNNKNYNLKKKDRLYYAHIIPTVGIYDICEIIIRTVKDNWFVGIDKKGERAYYFSYKDINNTLFFNRKDALDKVKDAEKHKLEINNETDYEEY